MKGPIVVIDSSVMVVAAMSKRANYSIDLLNLAFENKVVVMACHETLNELKNVFNRPKFTGFLDTTQSKNLIRQYVNTVKIVTLQTQYLEKVSGCCADPKDYIFLALADQVKADYLATLDSGDLLILEKWQGVKIVRPIVICKDFKSQNT